MTLKRKDFRSNFEFNIARVLATKGIKFEYESKSYEYTKKVYRPVCLECGSKKVVSTHKYTPDFFLPNGIVIETKGKVTPSVRTNLLEIHEAMQEQGVDWRLVFMRDNWLTKKRTKRLSEWAEDNGIKYFVGRIPDEWLKEKQ